MKFLLLVLFAIAFAQTATGAAEKCPPVKNKVIKRVHHVVIPINVPYPVYKELPFDGKPITTCPPNFKKTGNKCVHIVKTTDICPTQYSRISDTECIRVIVIDTIDQHALTCPPGYKFDKVKGCVLVNKIKYPKLPPIVIPKKPKPIHVLPPIKPIKCPKGYKQVGKYRCKKVLGCPKGTRKVKGKCVSKARCKQGELVILGTCVKTTKCPFGYGNVNGICVKGRKPTPKPKPKNCDEKVGIKKILSGFTTITKIKCSKRVTKKKITKTFIDILRGKKGKKCTAKNQKSRIAKSFDKLLVGGRSCTGINTSRKISKSFAKLIKKQCKRKGQKIINKSFSKLLKSRKGKAPKAPKKK